MDWRECGANTAQQHNNKRLDAFSLRTDALIYVDEITYRNAKRLWIVHMWPRPFFSLVHSPCSLIMLNHFLSVYFYALYLPAVVVLWNGDDRLCFAFVTLHWYMFCFNCFVRCIAIKLFILISFWFFYMCRTFKSKNYKYEQR